MDMQPIDSSNIAAIGYDPTTRKMQVDFHNGASYQYEGVTPDTHRALLDADSPGASLRGLVSGLEYQRLDNRE